MRNRFSGILKTVAGSPASRPKSNSIVNMAAASRSISFSPSSIARLPSQNQYMLNRGIFSQKQSQHFSNSSQEAKIIGQNNPIVDVKEIPLKLDPEKYALTMRITCQPNVNETPTAFINRATKEILPLCLNVSDDSMIVTHWETIVVETLHQHMSGNHYFLVV